MFFVGEYNLCSLLFIIVDDFLFFVVVVVLCRLCACVSGEGGVFFNFFFISGANVIGAGDGRLRVFEKVIHAKIRWRDEDKATNVPIHCQILP